MANNMFERSEQLLGSKAIDVLNASSVVVFGVGGVGGYVIEGLVRSGVGKITIIDNDVISINNVNRQLVALHSTVGKYKVDVMKSRILDINPNIQVEAFKLFYLPDTADLIDLSKFDYIVDAIDNVTAKIELIRRAKSLNIPIISCMGTGNKVNPLLLKIDDIYNTSVCPLARIVRHELRKYNITDLKVVYSTEKPNDFHKERTPSSVVFVPGIAGLLISGEVVKDLINQF